MSGYDDWIKADEEDEDELQDSSFMDAKRDVILFCIDCSPSMQVMYDDPLYVDVQTSHLYAALEAAVQIQKKKIIVGPNDYVGIMLFNTTKARQGNKNKSDRQNSEIKANTYLYQEVGPLSAETLRELVHLLEEPRHNLAQTFPPLPEGQRVPLGDVFTSCNWVIRDGPARAPKSATKRVFLITDEDQPHTASQLITSARTTLVDLTQAGITVEPFFISTEEKSFNVEKFYSNVLLNNLIDEEGEDSEGLAEHVSISRIDDLLAQMRFREVPKRAQFSVPFKLAEGLTIGVKGYGLVTEQKKGQYRYFSDLGDRMEVAESIPAYVDTDLEQEVNKQNMLYGMNASKVVKTDPESKLHPGSRIVLNGQRPFYTAEEMNSFRTLGLSPGIKLLGFKDKKELAFEDNIKHSLFIHPDEVSYSGSKRTFSALVKSLLSKKKIGLTLCTWRRNSTPVFCAMLPQEENDDSGWTEPAGFHLIPLPFADDIRTAPIEKGLIAGDELTDAAADIVGKLCIKDGGYNPDAFPNPSLAVHNAQLQAMAFKEEFDMDDFEDVTLPKVDMMHKRAGALMKKWKEILVEDESAQQTLVTKKTGTKRSAETPTDEAEIRSRQEAGTLSKLTNEQLKTFLKSKAEPVSGTKAVLVDRIEQWLETH
ncbi:Ku DNA-binding complex, Ku70 subunit [Cylindrobasidium torrendii FP15055 ss-10]|uniref:ATP-dependent DNA helicase II subunit 1 n=1 Tax=Cylindrobasidium torrendii FP15055 ss-10 TaxID=1314674 RepID=A0A0D7BN74_9AGAR|nr:Ku DNA-binding complex, Ku70 subunit [Cylindrobasidium torrendii FP15055 ss-10]